MPQPRHELHPRPAITDDTALVTSILSPLMDRTPQRCRFVATFFDADKHILSVQTLALCPPPARRIDCKRLLSLARWPQGASGVVFAHNQPGVDMPDGFDAPLTESIRHLSSLCHTRQVDLLDYLIIGRQRYGRASRSSDRPLQYFVRGWK